MSNKAFEYRLYPNKEQSKLIDNTISYARKMHNLILEDTIAHYEQTREHKVTPPSFFKSQERYSYFYEVDTTAFNNERRFVDTAFKNFFSRRNNGVGFPRFRSKHKDKWSYTSSYTNNNIRLTSVVDGKEIKDKDFVKYTHIRLPRIGFVRCVVDRPIPDEYRILAATVTKTRTNKYFVSIRVEYSAEIPVLDLDLEKSVGLDYSQNDFYVDSQGALLVKSV